MRLLVRRSQAGYWIPAFAGMTAPFMCAWPTCKARLFCRCWNDTYLISGSMVSSGQTLTISDSIGSNSIQLASGLSIASSQATSNALQLSLSNGGTVTVLDANFFTYDVGGNNSAGIDNVDVSYASFAQNTLGVAVPATGVASGGAKVIASAGTTPAMALVTLTLAGVITPASVMVDAI